MIFSLVLPTIHRVAELKAFLDSVQGQNFRSLSLSQVEVIVVDQNPDDRLAALLAAYEGKFPIRHLKIAAKGLSNARNQGLAAAGGRYLAFPDDDCFYGPDTLEKAYGFFQETGGKMGLFIRALDPQTGEDFLRYPPTPKLIRSSRDPNLFLGCSISQFYPMEAVRAAGDFDESFGIGGPWGSGEETDYAARVLGKGFPIQFRPEINVYHLKVNPLALRAMPKEKVKAYARGFGALCRKHGFVLEFLLKTLKQTLGILYFALRMDFHRSEMCRMTALGRLQGFWGYGKAGGPGQR